MTCIEGNSNCETGKNTLTFEETAFIRFAVHSLKINNNDIQANPPTTSNSNLP